VISAEASDLQSSVNSRRQDQFGSVLYWVDFVTKGVVTARYKGAVTATVSPPTFAEQAGFSLSNFLPTVWNLIPYSFLVDCFTNIGQVIDGASLGTVYLSWGCKTIRRVRSRDIARSNATCVNGLNPRAYISASGGHSEWVVFQRSAVSAVTVGLSDLSFRVPGIGSTKWLNIAALAHLRTL